MPKRFSRFAARSTAAMLVLAIASPLRAESQLLPLACPERASSEPPVEGQTVVVLELGTELSCALTAALVTWNLTVVAHSAFAPARQGTRAASRIASRYQARLVVWLSAENGEYQLRIYDPSTDDMLSRSVPEPPYDGATAAALALSVKTLAGLGDDARQQALASSAEAGRERSRPGASTQGPVGNVTDGSGTSRRGGSPSSRTAEGSLGEANGQSSLGGERAQRGQAGENASPSTSEGSDPYYYDRTIYDVSFAGIRARPTFGLAGYGGVRVQPEGLSELRYGAELRWEFARPWSGDAALWASVAGEVGPTREVETEHFAGGLDEFYGQVGLGLSHDPTSWLRLAIGGSATLGTSTLTGYANSSPVPLAEQRWNGALGIRTEVQWHTGAIALYIQPGASAWLRRQRYVAGGETVVQTQRFSLRAVTGLMVGW